MAGDRTPDEIQREIEQARASLAVAVDQLAYRTNPRRVADGLKAALIARAQSPQGAAVLGGVGLVLTVVIVRRFRRH